LGELTFDELVVVRDEISKFIAKEAGEPVKYMIKLYQAVPGTNTRWKKVADEEFETWKSPQHLVRSLSARIRSWRTDSTAPAQDAASSMAQPPAEHQSPKPS